MDSIDLIYKCVDGDLYWHYGELFPDLFTLWKWGFAQRDQKYRQDFKGDITWILSLYRRSTTDLSKSCLLSDGRRGTPQSLCGEGTNQKRGHQGHGGLGGGKDMRIGICYVQIFCYVQIYKKILLSISLFPYCWLHSFKRSDLYLYLSDL